MGKVPPGNTCEGGSPGPGRLWEWRVTVQTGTQRKKERARCTKGMFTREKHSKSSGKEGGQPKGYRGASLSLRASRVGGGREKGAPLQKRGNSRGGKVKNQTRGGKEGGPEKGLRSNQKKQCGEIDP